MALDEGLLENGIEIQLNENELKLKKLLLGCSEFIKGSYPDFEIKSKRIKKDELVMRFAGGWVRDKILNQESHDIDIALNSLTGNQFVEYLQQYMKSQNLKLSGIGRIQSNPDRSKHLETVTFRLFDLDIDVVNLRTETYGDTSRVPEMEFGTPKEDAMRRDITINSLFYNLHTGKIEDYCGMGISDLNNKIIRTPLPALETFKDDPLRVLRCIRFASRLGFTLNEDIKTASKNHEIKEALKNKISKERIGMELTKMIKENPIASFELIKELQLFDILFLPSKPLYVPPHSSSPVKDSIVVSRYTDSLIKFIIFQKSTYGNLDKLPIQEFNALNFNKHTTQIPYLMLTSYLMRFKGGEIEVKKNRTTPLIHYIIKENIKLPAAAADFAIAAIQAQEGFDKLINMDCKEWNRANVGLFMVNSRDVFFNGVILSTSLAFYNAHISPDTYPLDSYIKQLQLLLDYISKENLYGVHLQSVLLTGAQIQSTLQIKPSRTVGFIKDEVLKRQLLYPNMTVEECQIWLKEAFGEEEKRIELVKMIENAQSQK